MSSRLEQFIHDHREEFDADEPSKKLWEKIQHQSDHTGQSGRGSQSETGDTESIPVIWLSARRWSVAAAVSLLIAGSVWYLSRDAAQYPNLASNPPQAGQPKTTATTKPADKTGTEGPVAGTHGSTTGARTPDAGTKAASTTKDHGGEVGGVDDNYKQEMYYYAKLVEVKHKELTSIEKDEPLLYRQFSGDVNKLDSVYRALKKQLPENPNREQLLEAMLQNLQLQMGLLNHQLDIIKQINHSKKTAYEKAYKTV
jgi:hypothetical protein